MRKITKEDIQVKVKQVFEDGAVLLLYKDARYDMKILDETFGSMNWQADYKVVKDNLYCGIGVYDEEKEDWVWKWDCGIESREDGDGNEKKGEASDAFKRAGFKWGIGVELYSSPFIFANVETVEKDRRFYLKDKYIKFKVQGIWYDEDNGGDIGALVIEDNKGNIVFQWKKRGFITKEEKENLVKDKYNKAVEYLKNITMDDFRKNKDKIKKKILKVVEELLKIKLEEEAVFLDSLLAEKENMC